MVALFTPVINSKMPENHPIPRILQVLPALETGGVERGAIDIARFLKTQGETFVTSSGGPLVARLTQRDIPHFTLPLNSKNPWVMWRNVHRLYKIIKDNNIDIVHARSRAPAWSAYYAAQKAGCHFVTTFHGTYNFTNRFKKDYNSIMTRGEIVIAPSSFIKDHIHNTYGTSLSKIRVIHRGIDPSLFDPMQVTPARLQSRSAAWHLDDGIPVILCPGRLSSWKGQGLLIDALAILAQTTTLPFQCVFVGSHQGREGYQKALDDHIAQKGLAGRVRIAGPTDDMTTAYMLSDIVVSPSLDPEAFGRIVAEASAMGRPVVASRHGGAVEIIEEGVTGCFFEPGNAEDLALVLKEALNWPMTRLIACRTAARTRILEHFTLETMCRHTLAVYRDVMEQRP